MAESSLSSLAPNESHLTPERGFSEEAARRALRWVSIPFAIASLVHAVGLFRPDLLQAKPLWFHALFVVINATVAIFLPSRPLWLTIGLMLLLVHQYLDHGSYLIECWTLYHRIDWQSVPPLIGLPILLFFLIRDALQKRAARA